jgi:hypothetical protein
LELSAAEAGELAAESDGDARVDLEKCDPEGGEPVPAK